MGTDGIFLITGEKALVEMTSAPFITEDELQELLEHYPTLLPGGQINPSEPRRWLLVSREMGVPRVDGGADHFSLDHLFVDQDAVPTFVEVKRHTDTRIRREVVGQMLDYAANGVRYWPVERLRGRLAERVGGPEAAEAAVVDLVEDGDVEAFWKAVEDNLRTGRVRMMFVADVVPPELQRIVEFLNEQMATAEVLALEMRQYAADGYRTLVPALIGRTGAAQIVKRQTDQVPFAELVARASPEAQEFEERLTAWAAQRGWITDLTRAGRRLLTPEGIYVFRHSPGLGRVEVDLRRLDGHGLEHRAEQLAQRLEGIVGGTLTRRSMQVPVGAVLQHWDEFFEEFLPDYLAAVALTGEGPADTAEPSA